MLTHFIKQMQQGIIVIYKYRNAFVSFTHKEKPKQNTCIYLNKQMYEIMFKVKQLEIIHKTELELN